MIDDGGLDALTRTGAGIDDAALDRRITRLTTERLATIVYTSGTTGRPKGCAITHGNLRTNVMQNVDAVRSMLGPDEVSLVFLPMAHTLQKIIALVGTECGIKLAFATDVAHLREELALVRPTMVVAVPRVFEKVFNGAQSKAHAEGHGGIFDKSVEVAIRWSENEATGGFHPITGIAHAALERMVYRKLQAVFGGRMRFVVSGGAPLGERLTHFFNGIGVMIFEGYGLTETSPVLTVNRADAWKPGTVGTPLASTSIRIADDGEILVKGPQVFQGYWQNDGATAEVFDDNGWFLTGDVGTLDDDGFLQDHGPQEGNHRYSFRQERRAGTARGPPACASVDQRGGRRRRCPTLHRRVDRPRPRGSQQMGNPSAAWATCRRRYWQRTPTCGRSCNPPSTKRTGRCRARSRSESSRCCPGNSQSPQVSSPRR